MRGCFLDEWVDRDARAALREAFAHYDEEDAWRALFATGELFGRVSREAAGRLGVTYPETAALRTTELVQKFYDTREE
jgi:hypothetical protein